MSRALYKPLGDNDEATRRTAAQQLTSELATILAGERSDAAKGEIEYALGRLTKGLSSSRQSARPGFALALSEFVKDLQSGSNPAKWDVPFETVLESVLKHTHPSSGLSKQEERGYHLGRLFGLQSLVSSGALLSSPSTLPRYEAVLSQLLELAKRKPWLAEACAGTICSAVNDCREEEVLDRMAEATYKALVQSGMAKTAEGVGVWLTLMARTPGVEVKEGWKAGGPLAKGGAEKLARVLKEGGKGEEGEEEVRGKGSWSPRLGAVWGIILEVYFQAEGPYAALRERGGIISWAEFWRTVVDESLFSASASNERKFWGFTFFMRALDHVPSPAALAPVLSKNLLRSLTNQLSDAERLLHKLAARAARKLVDRTAAAPWMAPVVAEHLVLHNGTPNFDRITKTKTVLGVLCNADEKGLVEVVGLFEGVVRRPVDGEERKREKGVEKEKEKEKEKERGGGGEEEEEGEEGEGGKGGGAKKSVVDARRQWAADQILTLVRSGKTPKTDVWLEKVLDLFVVHGYFEFSSKHPQRPSPPLSAESQAMLRARLMSCLTHMITLKDSSSSSSGLSWPMRAVTAIVERADESKDSGLTLAIELDDEITRALKKAVKLLHKIRKKYTAAVEKGEQRKATQLQSFELLYAIVVLQVYNGEPDALGLLDELQLIFKKLQDRASKDVGDKRESRETGKQEEAGEGERKEEEGEEGGEEEDEVDPSEVLVEILLSFLTKESKLFRTLAKNVFETFVGSVGRAGLEQMFAVLETTEGLKGQSELFDKEDDEADEEEDDDVEMLDADHEGENGEDSDKADSDIEISSDVELLSASSSDSSDSSDEAAAALDADLARILQTAPGEDGSSDTSGSDMDDDAMFALDAALASKLRQHRAAAGKSKKTQRRDATALIVTFKHGVLDLLETFARSRSGSPLLLELLLPCLVLARRTRDARLAGRALEVVRECSAAAKKCGAPVFAEGRGGEEEVARAWAILRGVQEEAGRAGGGVVGKGMGKGKRAGACSAAALLCTKALVGRDRNNVRAVVECHAEALKRWLCEREYRPDAAFFTDFVAWAGSVRDALGEERAPGGAEVGGKWGKSEAKDGKEGVNGKKGKKAGKGKRKRGQDDGEDQEENGENGENGERAAEREEANGHAEEEGEGKPGKKRKTKGKKVKGKGKAKP